MWKSSRDWQTMKIWIKSSVIILLMCIVIMSFLYLLLSSHQTSQVLLWMLVGVPTALAVALALRINRQMMRQLKAITRLFEQIGMGDYTARAAVLSEDELGTIASALNRMLDHMLTLIRSQEDYEALQAALRKLHAEVAEVATGDLTIEAEATSEMPGAIAEPFNVMIHELRAVVTRVQEGTRQMGAAANEIQATAESLAQGGMTQAEHIMNNSAVIDEMALAIQRVADNATLSAQVAEQALAHARKGTSALQDTIAALDQMYAAVEATGARITTLGEHSREVGTIVQRIGDVADRISVLTLNAAIEAALAGEAGQGFAVVAAEVERLAKRAAEATRQTDGLVQTIQTETHEAVIAIQARTREVEQGMQIATQVGQALDEVARVAARLTEFMQSISLTAQRQARGSESLSQAMREMAEVTEQTAAGTQQTALSISNLVTLADELRAAVSIFKLPAHTNGHQEAA
jgi:twitching motility protein PilJ